MGKALKVLAAQGVLTLGYGKIHLHKQELKEWVMAQSLIAPV